MGAGAGPALEAGHPVAVMAKRKANQPMPGLSEPSPHEWRRSAAEHVAEVALRTDPKMKRKKNAIVDAVMRATTKAMRKG